MKILAIGATGFVGFHVTRQLIAQGHQVTLFHRGNTTASDLDSIVHFYGTRNQLPNFKAQFEQFAPDVVLDIIPFTEAQAEDVVQAFDSFTQRMALLSWLCGKYCSSDRPRCHRRSRRRMHLQSG